jgi:hypothetical protein
VFFWVFPGVLYTQPLKMELTEGSETSANHNLTPGKYPKEHIQKNKTKFKIALKKILYTYSFYTIEE